MNFTMKLVGTNGLIMHNGRLADSLDPAAKELKALTGKRKKTDADQEELACVEFAGALYHDETVGPYIPGDNIWKAIQLAARKSKDGKRIEEGIIVTSDVNPLVYTGPRDIDGLYQDKNFVFRRTVRVGTSRVARTRPIFQQWVTEVDGTLDESVMNFEDLNGIIVLAGQLIGLCDWRPRYGRFTATVSAAR